MGRRADAFAAAAPGTNRSRNADVNYRHVSRRRSRGRTAVCHGIGITPPAKTRYSGAAAAFTGGRGGGDALGSECAAAATVLGARGLRGNRRQSLFRRGSVSSLGRGGEAFRRTGRIQPGAAGG